MLTMTGYAARAATYTQPHFKVAPLVTTMLQYSKQQQKQHRDKLSSHRMVHRGCTGVAHACTADNANPSGKGSRDLGFETKPL
jgi:hypothetical protein